MKRLVLITFFMVAIAGVMHTQSEFTLEGYTNISRSTMVWKSEPTFYKRISLLSLGMRMNAQVSDKMYAFGGLGYNQYGATLEIPITTAQMPEGTGEFEIAQIKASTIGLNLGAGYDIAQIKKCRLSPELGFTSGVLVNQSLQIEGDKRPLSIFNDLILTGVVSIRLAYESSDKTSYFIRPSFYHQLNSNNAGVSVSSEVIKFQLTGYGVDLGFTYRL